MNTVAKIYIGAVTLAGLVVLTWSIHALTLAPDIRWWYLILLALIGSYFPVRIPLQNREQALTITVTDLFIFSSILMFGPELAAIIAACDAALSNLRAKIKAPLKQLFNVAQLSTAGFVAGKVFYLLQGGNPPLNPELHTGLGPILSMGLCTLLYFVLNSGAVALAVALSSRSSFLTVWRQDFLWSFQTTSGGASAALINVYIFNEMPLVGISIVVPIALIMHYAYQTSFRRIQAAQDHVDELNRVLHSTISSLAMAIDAKDQCTHDHVNRVQSLTLGLARRSGIKDQKELDGLRAAALLHDIGKIAVPDSILNKPSALTEYEMEKMKAHPLIGAEILSSVPFPYPVLPYVRHHHERWDGNGYPDGLKGVEIPLGARILSISDCYDALTSDRPYRKRLSREAALEVIQAEAGRAYDPMIVKILVTEIDRLDPEPNGQTKPAEFPIHTILKKVVADRREIQAVHDITQSLGKSLNVNRTLESLSDRVREFVPYDLCVVYLVSEGRLSCHFARGLHDAQFQGMQLRLGQGVSGWVAANLQTLSNISPSPDFKNRPELANSFRSCLAVPLIHQEEAVGVITLYSSGIESFRKEHIGIMNTIAQPAALALRNAHSFENSQLDAYSDPLTGLPNRRYFEYVAAPKLRSASPVTYPISLLMMDLDGFKGINDSHGHMAGDHLLSQVADLLKRLVRRSDICIRYGGDEFLAILPGVGEDAVDSIVRDIQEAFLRHRFTVGSSSIEAGISIGSATLSTAGSDLEQILAQADRAMYENKSIRKRTTEVRIAGSATIYIH